MSLLLLADPDDRHVQERPTDAASLVPHRTARWLVSTAGTVALILLTAVADITLLCRARWRPYTSHRHVLNLQQIRLDSLP